MAKDALRRIRQGFIPNLYQEKLAEGRKWKNDAVA